MSRNFDILLKDEGAAEGSQAAAPPPSCDPNGKARPRKLHDVIEDEVMKLVQRVFILPGAAQAPGAEARGRSCVEDGPSHPGRPATSRTVERLT